MHGRRKVKPALISLAFLISGAMPGLPAGEPTFPATPEPYRRGQGVLYFQADGSIDKVCFLWNEREYEIPADYRWTAPLENNLNWQHGMASLRWLRCALEMASSSAPAEDLLREFLLSFYDQHFQSGKVTTPHYYGDHTWAV
nr:hypothetical protein [Candidatus Krumholzibacteriota bacterium]